MTPWGIRVLPPLAKGDRGGFERTPRRTVVHILACAFGTAALSLFLTCGCGPGGCAATVPAAGGVARSSQALSPALSGRVVRILDGDSLAVLSGGDEVEVRLHGVDAPEGGQACGNRARRFAGDLAFGRQVELRPRGKDAYGRTLAEVHLPDGRSLNRELVSAGLAWHYRKYSDDADLAAREKEARAARRGLWADPAPVPPWEWREAHRR
jgi:endonuclease YncB( thermonuclease family)